jgi:hypothetical protein
MRRRSPRTASTGGGGGDRREAGETVLTGNDGPSDARADAIYETGETVAASTLQARRAAAVLARYQRVGEPGRGKTSHRLGPWEGVGGGQRPRSPGAIEADGAGAWGRRVRGARAPRKSGGRAIPRRLARRDGRLLTSVWREADRSGVWAMTPHRQNCSHKLVEITKGVRYGRRGETESTERPISR